VAPSDPANTGDVAHPPLLVVLPKDDPLRCDLSLGHRQGNRIIKPLTPDLPWIPIHYPQIDPDSGSGSIDPGWIDPIRRFG